MKQVPTLQTRRLILRPFHPSDAGDVQRLAGEKAIADTTRTIPHPYPEGAAETWIRSHSEGFASGALLSFAVTLRDREDLIGAISLMNLAPDLRMMEMGFWIGTGYWNRGYCTEAGVAVLDYGFSDLKLNRIHGHCLKRNPASGRVMEKIGMVREGCLRQHMRKWDVLEDIVLYGILNSEWKPVMNQ